MALRSAPLPGDLQYFLDGAIEAWEIGAFCYDCITLFGETEIVDRITEQGSRNGHWRRDRQLRCVDLDAYAHDIAKGLGERWQRALMASSIPYEIKMIHDVAEICAGRNHEDQTVGGALESWRKVRRCDGDFDPTKALKRRLYSPKAIRRYVKTRCQVEFAHAKGIVSRLRRLPWPESLSEGLMIADAREEALQRYRRLVETQVERMCAEHKSEIKVLAKPERKKLARAASIASAVVGDEKVRRFVSGAPVEIEGDTMILEARSKGSLTRHMGHGQIEVAVKNKDRVKLGNLCVYFDGTPALDQLAALALHVGSGNERDILTTGNLYHVTAEGATDPLLSNFMRKREERMADDRLGRALGDQDRRRRAQLRYFADVGHHYAEAATTQIWGRDGKRLRAFAMTTSQATA